MIILMFGSQKWYFFSFILHHPLTKCHVQVQTNAFCVRQTNMTFSGWKLKWSIWNNWQTLVKLNNHNESSLITSIRLIACHKTFAIVNANDSMIWQTTLNEIAPDMAQEVVNKTIQPNCVYVCRVEWNIFIRFVCGC